VSQNDQSEELPHLIARQRAVTIAFDSDRFESAARRILPLGLQPLRDFFRKFDVDPLAS
jgi:hypothetical protein